MSRRRPTFDLPSVLTPHALLGAMLMIVLAALVDDDGWMHAAGAGLLIDAAFLRVYVALREG